MGVTGTKGTRLVIKGKGFDKIAENNVINIGAARCLVTSSTSTQLLCDVSDGEAGFFQVDINIKLKGAPRYPNGRFQFRYNAKIDSISPKKGSIQGNRNIVEYINCTI